MVLCTFRRLRNLLLLVLCCYVPNAAAFHFSHKDLAMILFIGKLLKPRFVPLPIPIPVKIPFTKTTVKHYPVPSYGHSIQAQSYGGSNDWMSGLNADQLSSDSGTHALAQLESASENIYSFVQQLSLSPDVIKDTGDSYHAPTLDDIDINVENYLNFQDGNEWWRRR